MRLFQLKRLRPYIRIYKHTILPLIDNADFMMESTCPTDYNNLVRLQERVVQYIDNNVDKTQESDNLCKLYNIQPMKLRWWEHALCLMYQQSQMKHTIESERSQSNLRSNKKVKFKKRFMNTYEIYLKSPLCSCSKIWDMLKPEVQRATTKVKFKNFVMPMCRPT